MDKSPTILDEQLIQCTLVACGTLLIYDLLCTLDQEVAYAWAFPWSTGTFLFFLNRYLPFVDTFLSLKLKLTMNSPETCLTHYTVVTWFTVAGIILSEVVLLLRTYAIWGGNRSVLIILCISSALTFIPAIIVTEIELRSLRYIPTEVLGCRLGAASSIIIVAYIALAFFETVVAILTGVRAYQTLRHSEARWIIQLYQEGLLFYLYCLSISLANVLVPIFAPRFFSNWLATPQRVVHSVVANRVLLLIFKQKSTSNMTNRVPRRGHTGGAEEAPYFRSYEDEGYSANLTIVSPLSLGFPSSDTTPSHVDSSVIEVDPAERETVIRGHQGAFAY
ncbi:hypothetical protein M413DRAFT_448541 [Hebeloma cylindrosporum]|uniref:DUF6533 domain-containing protein n=1 Tax=Hebeloma cylindrosporum TaxID=76867 RepID=A0A0C3BZM4_HEBCY|nr:hypothetical protein M413DRAFT_448541 [Hebeloma cylindrosporum h7]